MNMLQVLVYLDDLIIFGKTLAEHEERLVKVLDRLQEARLKISLNKCQFCQTKVKGTLLLMAGWVEREEKGGGQVEDREERRGEERRGEERRGEERRGTEHRTWPST
ncbi:hypothetical protein D4764_13G0000780 [Takifugu flavidus]|uniref:ribonuclease H n=1 Tax=Takifugu flavidus TaxID=433684 RepID=A0A5C6P8A3_9TELE|nr:hypothetical protein D4764_13G0000780 [Takifugu flavidus]